ncbi:ABC transporter ATP-binding protein [Mitsuaria sp. GD03876]|uniref:ABC transporter ATP-binding protein n=1 Tax=Mitsuaria sp. GD03876 TaxID=2975399 RepID=UPI00244B0057|nr:ABC transporter ATP-binding protein [Mitsuaria sp. GD03876]MDH0866497.1 ABC transporter ATP-binding protein [Mitsuaria sp. GD03876]
MALEIDDLHAFYGKSHVLHGVHLRVAPGEIVALLGRNGSGRSTTAKAIMGMVDARGGLRWQGRPLNGLAPYEIAHRGIAYVPESRDIFPRLTVHQNLMLGQKRAPRSPGTAPAPRGGERLLGRSGEALAPRRPGGWTFDDMYAMFPRLKEREHVEAGVLSGGEQQMLTLCRALMGDPELILIDEPTEGLAPKIVELVGQYLQTLKARGVSVLLIEQKLTIALSISDRVLVMGHGSIVFDGTPQRLLDDTAVRKEWLEV